MSLKRMVTDFIRLEQAAGNGSRLAQVGTVAAMSMLVATLASSEAMAAHVDRTYPHTNNYPIPINCDDLYGHICDYYWHYESGPAHDDYDDCGGGTCPV